MHGLAQNLPSTEKRAMYAASHLLDTSGGRGVLLRVLVARGELTAAVACRGDVDCVDCVDIPC